MIVVTTPTGQIGRRVLAGLAAAGEPVRAVARDRGRLEAGHPPGGIEVVEGSHGEPAIARKALDGAEAVFWCVPPDLSAPDAREHYLRYGRALADALAAPGSTVRRVVLVSSGGRGRAKVGAIAAVHAVEELLERTGVHLRSLRAGAFMENMLHQLEPLRHQGAFYYPIDGDFAVPVCATRDIGDIAVGLLRDRSWTGQAGPAVHGPADLSMNDLARIMTEVLGRPIRYQQVPEAAYEASLVEHGASEGFARSLVAMWREIAAGLHAADPRTPESTTPTTFEAWCREVLKPAIG
ncbi:NAD(P)H azoreductase [Aquisphaera giovannonii]|uniref:NAD(P)H azoreductase n=1 Tax=Aquisphaera giovannonii TaxID=406548 RepID=A0A5B9W316_9BACT|nr:NmrA family NAD(P)-binding protein [Aquisphaera giovannonii]QEH34988.1 NAD(P)H azoreductase [Aquisphaera giovannonii]